MSADQRAWAAGRWHRARHGGGTLHRKWAQAMTVCDESDRRPTDGRSDGRGRFVAAAVGSVAVSAVAPMPIFPA